MREYVNKQFFMKDSIHKNLKITCENGLVIDNSMLSYESFEYSDSICSSEQLIFGSCESSKIKFRVYGINAKLLGLKLSVELFFNNDLENPFKIGEFYVVSEERSSDRKYKDIEAYDSLYNIINTNVIKWYNSLQFPITLKNFRNSFFSHFEIEQEDINLINDNMLIEKTIETDKLSGSEVLKSICEVNGAFGHINENGNMKYIILKSYGEALFPSIAVYPSEELYPSSAIVSREINKNNYITCEYEDYQTKNITQVQMRNSRDDIGGISGEEGNTYIIENNFLLYGKTTEELQDIGKNFLTVVDIISYVPSQYEAICDFTVEVGDSYALYVNENVIYSYILERNVKGIQSFKETVFSRGIYKYEDNVNGLHSDIIQIKGKINELTRTNEVTRSIILDYEEGVESRLEQTSDSINAEIIRAKNEENQLSSRIEITESGIKTNVTSIKNLEDNVSKHSSEINQTSDSIKSIVNNLSEINNSLQSMETSITQNASNINLKVSTTTYNTDMVKVNNAVSYIELNKDKITSVVKDGGVSSKISQESASISIESNRFELKSTYCNISNNGIITCQKLKAKDAEFSGEITSSSGNIGGFVIDKSCIYSNKKDSLHGYNAGVYIGTDGIGVGQGGLEYDTFSVGSDGKIRIGYNSTINMQGKLNFDKTYGHIYSDNISLVSFTNSYFTFDESFRLASGKSICCSTNNMINFTNATKMEIVAPTIIIGGNKSSLGFFGKTKPVSKQSITKINTSSSTTAKQAADKVNELIDKLINYGMLS